MTNSPAPRATLLTPFTYAIFRAIWIAGLVSNVGTWMQNVAGVWLVTTLTTSALLVALMQAATSLPSFLLSMPAGAMADLVDRRKLLLFTQGFMAVVATGLGCSRSRAAFRPMACWVLHFCWAWARP